MSYTQEGRLGLPGGAWGNTGGAARSPEPRQVPLKLLLFSLEVLDVFHLGTQSHQGGEGGVSTGERAGRSTGEQQIPVDPAGWAPHHPQRDSRALQSTSLVLQLPAEGFQPAQGFRGRISPLSLHLSSPGQEGTAGLCALDLSCRWQIHPD